jgi:hypothetical protein
MNARAETYKHIRRVNELTVGVAKQLLDRAVAHDASKLESPEAELFEANTAKLAGLTYGSDEYRAALAELKPALDHHYANNRHHPEFHTGLCCIGCFKAFPKDWNRCCDVCGNTVYPDDKHTLRGMNLIDLLEMLCDWKAAGERHANGDLLRSIEVNQKRFGYSDELKQILLNTVGSL